MWLMFHVAVSAFHGSPLTNFTLSRSENRHRSGATCSQPVVDVVGPSSSVVVFSLTRGSPQLYETMELVSALPVLHGERASGSVGMLPR